MNQFDRVPINVPSKNVFTLDHDVKSSYNFDKLYPFLTQVVYPGDTWNCRAEVFMRTMPLLAPVMHNVDMRLYFFFVPMRLLWNKDKKRDWRTFITGGEKGDFGMYGYPNDHSETPVLPHFTYKAMIDAIEHNRLKNGELLDHMGFPSVATMTDKTLSDTTKNERICSLPFRAYTLVWNEYFRNQNVQNEVEFSYDGGLETASDLQKIMHLRKKCWEKDYFTSCLPFAQRGEAVTLPIDFNNVDPISVAAELDVKTTKVAKDSLTPSTSHDLVAHSSGGSYQFVSAGDAPADIVNDDKLALLGQATGSISIDAGELAFTGLSVGTINDFRYCLRLQQWLENNARCGSRYIEQLLAHFGVTSSDARLQRPELLGGGKIPILFNDVPQTSYGDGSDRNVLGDLAGRGTLYGKTNGFKKYFEEHGILLGLLCIVPRTSYCQGVSRVWTAFDKTDWYFPEFAHLGEQAVLNKELYFPVTTDEDYNAEPNGVFGYQGRFTELRYIPSSVHGEMRNTLDYWHFGRIFTQQPSLNGTFVQSSGAQRANCWALEDVSESGADPFVCQIHMDISAVRPMPKFAVPTL